MLRIRAANLLRVLPKAALATLLMAAPVLAVPAIGSTDGRVIEAPTAHKPGAGFVLLLSLQRA